MSHDYHNENGPGVLFWDGCEECAERVQRAYNGSARLLDYLDRERQAVLGAMAITLARVNAGQLGVAAVGGWSGLDHDAAAMGIELYNAAAALWPHLSMAPIVEALV